MSDVKKIAGYDIKDETARNALNNIGAILNGAVLTFSIAVAASGDIASITLPAGTWVVCFSGALPKPSGGNRCKKGYFSLANFRQGWDVTSNDPNASFYAEVTAIVTYNSETTLKASFINFGDDTCDTLDNCRFTAVRIK